MLTHDLFKPRHFMGLGKADAWHGKAIVPLAEASRETFTVELDSLSGTKRTMSLQEFLEVLLNRDPLGRDTFEIYSI